MWLASLWPFGPRVALSKCCQFSRRSTRKTTGRAKPSRPRAPGHVEKLDVGRRVPPPLPPMLPPAAQMTPRPEQTPGLPAMLRRPRTWQATPGTPPAMPLRLQPKPAVSGGCSSLGGSSSS